MSLDGPRGTTAVEARPLGIALGICVAFAFLGGFLSGVPAPEWYEELVRPDLALPPLLVALVTMAYYPVMAFVLYRALTRVGEAGPRRGIVAGVVGAMAVTALWDLLVSSVPPETAGVVGVVGSALVASGFGGATVLLLRRDRAGGALLALYLAWSLYELVFSLALWRLNG